MIRDAIRDASGDPEVTRSGIALLEQLYLARGGQPIPVDWKLHPHLDRLKVSVVRRESAYWTEYGLRVWGKQKEAGSVQQIRLTDARGEVVLDRNAQRGTWWTAEDAEDGPEFEIAFWENSHAPADGLYDLHVEFTDGSQWDAWLILSGTAASATPSMAAPHADQVFRTSRPQFEFPDFRTPEYMPFERRSLWYSLRQRNDSRPFLTQWEMSPTRTGFAVKDALADGDYTVGVFYTEARRFGPILIGRNAGTTVPFTIRTE